MSFNDFSFETSLEEALAAMGFVEPTPVQQEAIPLILQNKDLIACAQTGTGKTAAFVLPVLNKLAANPGRKSQINTLIIAPTRELAMQIDQQVEGFAYFTGVSSISVYGGGDSSSWDQQKRALKGGADIIIATPGRLISHINLGYVDLSHVKHFILDEADRMLDMGFFDDIMSIFTKTPKEKQSLLFSATMPAKIRQLAKKILHDPEQISLSISKPAAGVLQGAYLTYDNQKIPLIQKLLLGKKDQYQSVIIFTSTRRMVKEITAALNRGKLSALMISSDLEQKEREMALQSFKSKETQILVATDILARGIDIKEISLVINYDVPNDAEDYVHRVGRTARADSTGVALTFINPRDASKFGVIEKFLEEEINKIPLPTELGEAPAYEPNKRHSSGSGGRGRGGSQGRGGGGNRNGGGGRDSRNSGGRNNNNRGGSGGRNQSSNRNNSGRSGDGPNRGPGNNNSGKRD
ncbi:MAG: ATP-dependent RNA helicase RhlE [Polaribacter sp.]